MIDVDLKEDLTPDEQAEVAKLLDEDPAIWRPLKGPQHDGYYSEADVIGFGGAAGGGKGLALDTVLPTPHGWVPMGLVQVGQQVFGADGSPCTVTAVTEPVVRSCYRLTFDDGTTIVADDVHRWVTMTVEERSKATKRTDEYRAARREKRASRVAGNRTDSQSSSIIARNKVHRPQRLPQPNGTLVDTEAIAASLVVRGRVNHSIPVAGRLSLPEKDLPIPPYTLGAWLGDGSRRNGQLTSIDPGVWERIERDGYTVRHYEWDPKQHNILKLKAQLRVAGVLDNKHIPAAYLRASVAQRVALMQGLMDTDGHATVHGQAQFDNTNQRLAEGVLELASGLGLKATLGVGRARLNGRDMGAKWRVRWSSPLAVFGLQRKAARLGGKARNPTTTRRYIVACDAVESVPTRCIAVDSPSRQYLVSEAMVPTHNTDLISGLCLTYHKRCLVIRREKAQTEGIVQRMEEILGSTDGYSSQKSVWRLPTGLIEFGGLDDPGTEMRWQGRAHDLKAFDEATEMREKQVRFVMGWNRTSDPSIHPRVLLTFNPPNDPEGRWIIDFFGPWLDELHPNPAKPGELRWFTTIKGKDEEVTDTRPFVIDDGEKVYDFDPAEFSAEKIITPKSRTFIPARVTDNPHYMATGYVSQLQAMEEPFRSRMLYGDFTAGMEDDPSQVIPTAWVKAAQDRWEKPDKLAKMDGIGCDVARGGKDKTIIARRHGYWFDEALVYAGDETPDGPKVAGLVIAASRDQCPLHIDVVGVGSSPYDFLVGLRQQILGVNGGEKSVGTDRSGRMGFKNLKAELWWRMREALDPANNTGIALPPSRRLLADLCCVKFKVPMAVITVSTRDELVKSLGRSPDYGSAFVLALIDTPNRHDIDLAMGTTQRKRERDPYEVLDDPRYRG